MAETTIINIDVLKIGRSLITGDERQLLRRELRKQIGQKKYRLHLNIGHILDYPTPSRTSIFNDGWNLWERIGTQVRFYSAQVLLLEGVEEPKKNHLLAFANAVTFYPSFGVYRIVEVNGKPQLAAVPLLDRSLYSCYFWKPVINADKPKVSKSVSEGPFDWPSIE